MSAALLLFWFLFFVLRAGTGASSSSLATSSAQTIAPSQQPSVPPSPPTSSLPASSAPHLTDDPIGFISILPEGPYTSVSSSTTDKLAGSWMWAPQPQGQYTTTIYQFRFDEPAGHMMLSTGAFGSDAGKFYRGEYQIHNDGLITASLQESDIDAPSDLPYMHISFTVEWVPDTYDAMVITLRTLSTEDLAAADLFNNLIDRQLPYFRYS
jgi:hypothetical protein